ncbi:hypothetical protein AJ80_05365 [Polytolypa hystricis UAMH7299]|uniref:Major facilitator superfamily (MFS) profile domain-containing protein n=1 Tax=Polytolypa hystricis (strain UAMH7299) TaxID=1447883 RepID=A0A2B7Y4B7_POLH7|nr:hypothetical protein AJ80_05365 [Polytolypa hystricis UAMH7299]
MSQSNLKKEGTLPETETREKTEQADSSDYDAAPTTQGGKFHAVFENPLANVPRDQLFSDVENFCRKWNLMDHIDTFKKGALVSQNKETALDLSELDDDEREALRREKTHKWSQPWALYHLTVMCSVAAAVQGMDETVNNGTWRFKILPYSEGGRFSEGMADNITGLVVGAPYLACAILGCWLTEPFNRYTGRRGTIFISCFIAAVASIWEGVANSWINLFMARFVLGLWIGSKSSTVPVYAAECSPAPIRGALVMMWQMWTAFGIMLGNIMGVAFGSLEPNLAWRLMLGSTVVLPLFVCAQVYYCPELPRWLIQHDKVDKAFRSFKVALTLEELDQVFSVPTWKHASYQIRNTVWHLRVWIFRQKLQPLPKLHEEEDMKA